MKRILAGSIRRCSALPTRRALVPVLTVSLLSMGCGQWKTFPLTCLAVTWFGIAVGWWPIDP